MAKPTLAELYTYGDTLCSDSSTDNEKETAYRAILAGTKGEEKEKRLACQFIARFSKQFEDLKEDSFNCVLDLCDDDDVNIRKQAIRDLIQLCKRIRTFIPRVADVLVQMFQTENTSELHAIQSSLSQLLNLEPKPTLAGIFNQMLAVNPDNPRDHVMKFLAEQLKVMPKDLLTTEVEEFIVEQTHKVLQDVSEEEFQLLIPILSSLKCMSNVLGRQKLVTMITEQALQAVPDFQPNDPACVAQIRESCRQAVLCVSKNVHARELFLYLLKNVLPKLSAIPDTLNEDKLNLLRVTAELLINHEQDITALPVQDLEMYLQSAYNLLIEYLPEIPTSDEVDEKPIKPTSESLDCKKPGFPSGLKLSELECILFIVCQLARSEPQFFGDSSTIGTTVVDDEDTTRLRFIRPRLQYLNQIAQEYAQSIASHLNENGEANESKIKLIAHRLVSNLQVLVRCFFHNPPMFKSAVTFSWLQSTLTGSKRPAPMTLTSEEMKPNQMRNEQKRYTPPVGQWSRPNQPGWNLGRTRCNRTNRGRTKRNL